MVNRLNKARVHIAAIGFDLDRVVTPLKENHADRVHLIANANQEGNKAEIFVNMILKLLKKENIPYELHHSDIFDFQSVLAMIRTLILKEKGNEIFINIGTGTKISAVAGSLAGMMWNATIYYPKINYPNPTLADDHTINIPEQDVLGYIFLPDFKVRLPSPIQQNALDLIYDAVCNNNKPGDDLTKVSIAKKDLLELLNKSNVVIDVKDGLNGKIETRHYNWLNRNILKPLEKEWNYLKLGKHKVNLTSTGLDFAKILHGSSVGKTQRRLVPN